MGPGQDLAVQTAAADPVLCAHLVLAVHRAMATVRDETRALRANPTADLKPFEYRKSQALLDLTRARENVAPAAFTGDLLEALKAFRAVLDENIQLLALHKDAVVEVVDTLSKTMIDLESDGTYAAPFPERGI